jgi:putative RecB family exonuclease
VTPLLQVQPKRSINEFDHISFSAIATFQACPLRWMFRYVRGLSERTVSSSLVLGGALHKAIQYHFERLLVREKGADLDTLLAVFQDAWESYTDRQILFGKGDDRDKLGEMATRMLTAFLASDFAQPKGIILGVEEELRGEIIPGCPDLLARLDLIVDTGNELVVSDFKSSRSAWSDYKVEDVAPQLLLYSELVKPLADGKPIKLAFAVMTKTKTPELTVHDVPVDEQRVARTKRTVERIWQAIQSANYYPNPSPLNCGSCPYRGPCRAWTG